MRRLAVLLLAGLLVLSACGEDTGDGGSGAAGSASISLDSGDASVTVEGETGDEPEVTVDGEYSVDETSVEVMSEGDGDTVEETDTVRVNYHGVNGTTGEVFDSSFESGQPAEFPLDGVIPGFSKGLVDQKIGSRVVISVAPDDGYPQGTPDGAIKPGDSLIFVVDLLPEEEAPEPTGTVDDVTVTGEPGQKPEVSFDKPLYVGETASKVITPGDGPVVEAGDTVTVDYVGINGRTGEEFDASYTAAGSKPVEFPLDQVVPGFAKGLVGQKLGSRVAIAMPSEDGYGSAGNPQAGIEGNDTLVFVVDLIDPRS